MSEYLTSQRKDAHLDLAKQTLADRARLPHPLDKIELPYCALPELDLSQIDITTRFLGHQLAAPMLITGMTGGTARADRLNAALVSVAARHNIAIGLGSQRASLEAGQSQHVLRKAHPEACLSRQSGRRTDYRQGRSGTGRTRGWRYRGRCACHPSKPAARGYTARRRS